jgi:glycosyltransferase involved in cell wall biosynthesis
MVYKLDLHIWKPLYVFSQFIRMWKYYTASCAIKKEFDFDLVVYNNAYIGLLSAILRSDTAGMINDDNNLISSIFKQRISKKTIIHVLEFLFCRLSKRPVIVNSTYLKNLVVASYGIPSSRVRVFHKGIESNLVQQNRNNFIFQKIKNSVLFVKTDFMRGGLPELIRAVAEAGIPVKLGVVGPEEARVRELLPVDFCKNGTEVICYGHLPPASVFELMKKFEVFSVPSHREAFGVANLEALAFGCKIVSSIAGGIPEALHGAPITWLVNPSIIPELTSAIKNALDFQTGEAELKKLDEFLLRYSEERLVDNFIRVLSNDDIKLV